MTDDNNSKYKAFLIVRRFDTREEVSRIGLTNLSRSLVERVMMGMLKNMGEDYFIDDSEVDKARREKP